MIDMRTEEQYSDMTQTTGSPQGIARREFLKRSGAAVAAAAAATSQSPSVHAVNSAAEQTPPLVFGIIGCGRRGTQLIEAALRSLDVVFSMVCDVDSKRAAAAADLAARLSGNRPAATGDYHDVLDDPQIQAVIIATPDHWHTIPFLAACVAKKDIYVETPMALTLNEAHAITYATRKYKRVVQVGLQYRSSRVFNEAASIVRSGQLGRISQTRTWNFTRQAPIASQPDSEPPAGFDYDRWLGPAPQRPYNPGRVQNPTHFWDYGSGEATVWNVHLQDLLGAAMRVTVPKSVVAVGGNYGLNDARETPDTLEATFEYDTPANRFVHTYSLRLANAYAGWGPAALPPAAEDAEDSINLPARSGVQIFGSEKTLFVNGQRLLVLPAGVNSPIEDLQFLDLGTRGEAASTQPSGPDELTIAHVKQFAEGIRLRRDPSATVEFAETSLFPVIAASIAYRVGRKLYIEGDSRKFYTDRELKKPDEEATQLMVRMYRQPYEPPQV